MVIRQETEKDYDEVYAVVKAAFERAEHSDGNEQDLVAALRKGGAFVPELSLVAQKDGRIVGHILLTKGSVGSRDVLVLAPLSVLPENQSQGIGSALMEAGRQAAEALGYDYITVLGSEDYYPWAGYIPAEQLGIRAPFEVPPENFMALRLREDAGPVSGVLRYAAEFGL